MNNSPKIDFVKLLHSIDAVTVKKTSPHTACLIKLLFLSLDFGPDCTIYCFCDLRKDSLRLYLSLINGVSSIQGKSKFTTPLLTFQVIPPSQLCHVLTSVNQFLLQRIRQRESKRDNHPIPHSLTPQ